VFHSDVAIEGWNQPSQPIPHLPKSAAGKVWVANLPALDGTDLRPLTLYDADGRLPRARSAGFIPVAERSSRIELQAPPGLLRNWPNPDDVEIVIRPNHAWVVNILPLKSVDPKRHIMRTKLPATYSMNPLHFLKDTESVWVENVIDALDAPGEWVVDRTRRKLYLWPRNDGRPTRIVAPALAEYIRVEGQIDLEGPRDVPARNLVFRGLTFTRGETYRVTAKDKGLQHDWDLHDKANALVRLRGASHCVIESCHFVHSGGSAIRCDLLARHNQIRGNHIEHIGATGILLCGYGPGTKDVNHDNLVSNNHIHHVGEIYPHSPGIFLWQSGENRVANDLVHHTPYSGIIVSGIMPRFVTKRQGFDRELTRTIRWHELKQKRGSWQPADLAPYLHTHDNRIEYNEIHQAMQELGDGNGIYIRGAGPGNIIRRNYIHHLLSPIALQSAIRTDGGQRDTLIAENLIYRCVAQGIHLKLNNRAENNIIVDLIPTVHNGKPKPATYFKLREGPMTGAVIQRNILYHSGHDAPLFFDEGRTPRLPAAWAREADTDRNIYYCADPEQSRAVLQKGRRSGIDGESVTADPLFDDPAKGDFRLKADSPAHALGIQSIDLSKVGLLTPDQR